MTSGDIYDTNRSLNNAGLGAVARVNNRNALVVDCSPCHNGPIVARHLQALGHHVIKVSALLVMCDN